jgi:hypothetical protein
MTNYIKSRIKLLKDSRENYEMDSITYISLSSTIDELEFIIKLSENKVINNVLTSKIIEESIERAKK